MFAHNTLRNGSTARAEATRSTRRLALAEATSFTDVRTDLEPASLPAQLDTTVYRDAAARTRGDAAAALAARGRSSALTSYLNDLSTLRPYSPEAAVELAGDLDRQARALAALFAEAETALDGAPLPPAAGGAARDRSIEDLGRIRTALLPRCGERPDLAARIERGWTELLQAKTQLVQNNLKLVVHIAKAVARSLRSSVFSIEELIQEGNIGLMRAVEKYDHGRGVKFSTYGSYWIRAAMIRAIQNQARVVRIPVYTLEQMRRCESAQNTPAAADSRSTRESVAESTGIRESRIAELEQCREAALTLDAASLLSDESAIVPNAAYSETPSPLEDLIDREECERAFAALGELSARECSVIRWRCGLGDEQPLTFQAIATRLEVSAERVRQIEKVAIAKLRCALTMPETAERKPALPGATELRSNRTARTSPSSVGKRAIR